MSERHQSHKPDPRKKRVIEFDMFARDLEPEEKEDVRGGTGPKTSGADGEHERHR